jgi:hypothetical protein
MLKRDIQLNVNKEMIRRYMKERMGMKFKVIKPINYNHNSLMNKLKR